MLAIETSGASCSVCLDVDGNRFSLSEHADRTHNEMLLPMLGELRRQSGLDPSAFNHSLDAVAFGRGPGSFTGTRIAASTAQAIAVAAQAQVLRVSCSEALARKALVGQGDAKGVVTLIRSRRDLYYLATYRNERGRPLEVHSNRLFDRMPERDWCSAVDGWLVVGETASWWTGAEVAARVPDAESVLEIGRWLYAQGEGVSPAEGLPDYPEGDTPWRKNP